MQKLTFKSKLSWWFSLILASCLTLLTVVFAVFYVGFTLVSRQNFMMREAKEVYEKHILIENSEIFFKRDSENKTLSSYLRDEGLSAMVLDRKRNVIGTYGVYASLIEERSIESLATKTDLDKAYLEGKAPFGFYQLRENRTHLVMNYPVISDSEIVGVLVLASDLNFGPETVIALASILLLMLAISITIGWIFTYLTVSKQFRPLQRILNEMNDYEIGKAPTDYEIKGSAKDELVRLSKAFKSMVSRVHEGSQKQTEFIANVSHELKTPLANSLLTLNLAEMDLAEGKIDKAKSAIGVVKNDLKKFGDLINSLLEIAKIDKTNDKVKSINIQEIIEEIVVSYKGSIPDEIKIRIEKNVKINFPENHLRIILNNLIGNAIKYTKKRGRINIEVAKRNGIEIAVENEAIHLKSTDLQRIWQRNERLKVFKRITGNGIGLYLVKEVADHHGLTIHQNLNNGLFRISVSGF
jgi:signal transduction histidine kinase